MTPLTQLLQARMDEHGWRLRDVTRPPDGVRSGAPARATMSQHLQPDQWFKTMPRQKTIEELATAVRCSADEIRQAAWESMEANRVDGKKGIGKSSAIARAAHDSDHTLPLEGLTSEQQQQLRQLAELFRSQNPSAT